MNHTATYSPEDNKLRMTPAYRLDKEDYQRLKDAGFGWAPRQKIFVAPMWTPGREDILLEFCPDGIEDEDKSLVERAEERAERFEDYSDSRSKDAKRAHEGVSAIADNIPLGQPILIGHHSEKRARKDAERIENGMRRAIKMWETSTYWKERAKGALAHAKYKELPAVRARRIKGIEADKRKQERAKEHAEKALAFWSKPELTWDECKLVAGHTDLGHFTLPRKEGDKEDFTQRPDAYSCLSGENGANYYPNLYAPRELHEIIHAGRMAYSRSIPRYERWINHYENRLVYEKAMLEEQGASALIAPKARPTQLPLVNYRQPTFQVPKMYHRGELETIPQLEMTKAQFTAIYENLRGTRTIDNSHRVRMAMVPLRSYPQFRTEEDNKHAAHYGENCVRRYQDVIVFLTDSKEHTKPEAKPLPDLPQREIPTYTPHVPTEAEIEAQRLKDALKGGVQVVSAPQLFPTPPDLVRQMIELADLQPGECVLEPSAGTGNIVQGVIDAVDTEILAYEINPTLCGMLSRKFPSYRLQARQADFLTVSEFQGCYPKILMNPPFSNGDDIKHIQHARKFLAPGGRLVAICANGTRQQEALKPLASEWIDLPADSFKDSGTSVNTAMLVIEG